MTWEKRKSRLVHPGEILSEEFLKPLGLRVCEDLSKRAVIMGGAEVEVR